MLINQADKPPNGSYNGFCRFGSGRKNWIFDLDTANAMECYEQCKLRGDCVAFAYNLNFAGNDCDLYRGGPYTYGNGRKDTTCYVMPEGIFDRFLNMHYNFKPVIIFRKCLYLYIYSDK